MVKTLRIVEKRTTRVNKKLDQKVSDAAALILQKCFRGHRARKDCNYLVGLVRHLTAASWPPPPTISAACSAAAQLGAALSPRAWRTTSPALCRRLPTHRPAFVAGRPGGTSG